jgi:dodecin
VISFSFATFRAINIHLKFLVMAVLKVIEVMASSKESWEDAVKDAVKSAAKTVKGIRSVYIQDQSAVVKDNKVAEFRVTCKVTFEVFD